MKFFRYLILFLVALPASYFAASTVYEYSYQSKNYRENNSPPNFKRILSKHCFDCLNDDYKGSDKFPFSGGGRVNFKQMKKVAKKHNGPVYVVNLRDENGLYYNYHPISYYGIRKKDEGLRYATNRSWKKRVVYRARRYMDKLPTTSSLLNHEQVLNEGDTLKQMGIHYIKYELFRKNFSVHWEFVDKLVELFESFPDNAWVHFHCAGGRGRTTTVAIMYDIFRNGTSQPLETITQHHFCIGGEDMMDTALVPKGTWTKEKLEGRKALIQTFYKYMSSSDGYPNKTWSQWLEDHDIPMEFTYEQWEQREWI